MNDTIEAAKAPGVFSLDKFLVDVAYPMEEVVIHTDAYSVNEKLKLVEKRNVLEKKSTELAAAKKASKGQRTISDTAEETSEIEDALMSVQSEVDAWDEKIEKSALTIQLQGMPPHIVDEITKKHFVDPKADYNDTPQEEARDLELVARSIVKITDAEGNISAQTYEPEDVAKLKNVLLSGEYHKIVVAVAHVNLNGALFDQAVDASFLS